ncbi:MAG: methyltransferase domain-containing protein [Firmicutes bacterium]|nr:methyltransferase domain-containing protein [Bacillota bacterium]
MNSKTERFLLGFKALSKIIREGAYANIALNDLEISEQDRPFVVSLVLGVLERYYELSFALKALSPKAPKPPAKIIFLQAFYALKYMDIPAYAVVNESVELVGAIGKKELKGYVNAVLHTAVNGGLPAPHENSQDFYEAKFNLPLWIINAVKNDYPLNYEEILLAKARHENHVRLSKNYSPKDFESALSEAYEKTEFGYFVKNSNIIKRLFSEGKLTFQGLTSIMAVNALGDIRGKKVLDLCSAPGGKSVLMAEKGAEVTSTDISEIRLKLIEAYARRMRVKLSIFGADATVFNKDYEDAYDIVLADVPCSGLGVLSKRQDMIFNRKEGDIESLSKLQSAIISNASRYVKRGGTLMYSTCTILKKENQEVIKTFLKDSKTFTLESQNQVLPSGTTEGFYFALLSASNAETRNEKR